MRFASLIRVSSQAAICTGLLFSSGCSDSSTVARLAHGICSELAWEWCQGAPEPAELLDVILHVGNSAVTPDHAGTVYDRVLARMLARPESTLRVWAVRPREEPTRLLTEITSPPVVSGKSERHRSRERMTWAISSREHLMSVTAAALAEKVQQGSPARAVAEVALANPGGKRGRSIILISDGVDAEVANVVCQNVSTEDGWMDALPWHRYTRPGLFASTTVYISYFGPNEYPSCAATTLRYEVLSGMWFNFLRGAPESLLRAGPVVFTDFPFALMMEQSFRWVHPK